MALNIARRCSRIGSFSTLLTLLKTMVGRSVGLKRGHRGSLGVFGSPVAGEGDPRVADFVRKSHRFRAPAGEVRRNLYVVEREGNLDRMRGLQSPSLHRRLPTEVVQVNRCFVESRAALGDLHDGCAVAIVAGDQEVNIRRCRTWIQLAIGIDHAARLCRRSGS